jgi:hypothetical protein
MMAKSNLRKEQTFPRSELNSGSNCAAITRQLLHSLKDYNVIPVICIVSQICLWWLTRIRNVLALFHRVCVNEIREVFKEHMYHIKTNYNSADSFSRLPLTHYIIDPLGDLYQGPAWIRRGLSNALKEGILTKYEDHEGRPTRLNKSDNIEYRK